MRSDQQQAINRLAGTSATAFLCAVLCVYPLYIDKFSNLGVTKFTGCFTLFLLFLLWLVACTAIGARALRLRNANAGRDVTLWGVLAFAGTSLISTFTSLSPTASTWGLGGYYGGLMLVLFIFVPALNASTVGIMVPVGVVFSLAVARILYKKGLV